MWQSLFLKIVDAIVEEDKYFAQKRDVAGQLGFSPLQKGMAAMRMLAYGYSAESIDEYLCISQHFILGSFFGL
jgi:hypothetical protein